MIFVYSVQSKQKNMSNIRQKILENRQAFREDAKRRLAFPVSDLWYAEMFEVIRGDNKFVVSECAFWVLNETHNSYEQMIVNEIILKKTGIQINTEILKKWSENQRNLERVTWLYHANPLAPQPTLPCPLYSDELPTNRKLVQGPNKITIKI